MAYDKQTWVDGAQGGTPVSAARLQHLDDGVAAVDSALATLVAAGILTPTQAGQTYATIAGVYDKAAADARYATAAQGSLAASAVQPATLNSALATVAPLVNGVVPAVNLPSYVDDVLEFANVAAFPATGESGKLYVSTAANKTYRWAGSQYAVVSDSIALGETSSTAYPGDKGKANADAIAAAALTDTTVSAATATLAAGVTSVVTGVGPYAAPAVSASYDATKPQRFGVRNGGTAQVVLNTKSSAGADLAITLLPGEARVYRQASASGYALESGIPLARMDERYGPAGVLLPASNGTDDTAVINAAIVTANTLGVSRVIGRAGQTYLTTDSIVLRSNVTLDMNSVTINGPATKNLVRNASTIPARTVTDGVSTNNSTTISSATAAFTSADVGKAFGMLGAGPRYGLGTAPGTWYGTITAVANDGLSATASVAASSDLTGCTLNIFPARDTNVRIVGGTWNGGQRDSVAQSLAGHSFYLRRIDGLILDRVRVNNTRSNKGGGYGISCADVTQVEVASPVFNTGTDGVHFQGPARYVNVHDVIGTSGDDLVAFTTVDGQSVAGSLLGDADGDITDVTVTNVHAVGAWTALKLTSGSGSGSYGNLKRTIRRFRATGITGSTSLCPVNITDYCGSGDIEADVTGVACTVATTGQALVTVSVQEARTIRLRDLTWDAVASGRAPTNGIVSLSSSSTIRNIVVDGLTYIGSTTGGIGVRLNRTAQQLSLSNVNVAGAPATFKVVSQDRAGTDAFTAKVSGVYCNATDAQVWSLDASDTGVDLDVSDGYMTAGTVLAGSVDTSTSKASTLRLRAWRQVAGTLASVRSPLNAFLEGVTAAPTAGAVVAASAAATPIRVVASSLTLTSGTVASRSASQAVSVHAPTAPVDQTILTPADGDEIVNSNSSPANGVGRALWNAAAAKWKNLYSGTTN